MINTIIRSRNSGFARKNGFTLAEVLITLGIIGVVAALVLPGVIEGYQKKEIAASYMKVYSSLSQLTRQFDEEYGPAYGSYIMTAGGTKIQALSDYLAQNLKLKKCTSYLNGNHRKDQYLRYIMRLRATGESAKKGSYNGSLQGPTDLWCSPNGVLYMLPSGGSGSSTAAGSHLTGLIWVDVNGLRAPNVWFKDIFYFTYIPYIPTTSYEGTFKTLDYSTGIFQNYYSKYAATSFSPVKIPVRQISTAAIYPGGYGVFDDSLPKEAKIGCTEKRDGTCGIKIITNGGSIPKDYPWQNGKSRILDEDN